MTISYGLGVIQANTAPIGSQVISQILRLGVGHTQYTNQYEVVFKVNFRFLAKMPDLQPPHFRPYLQTPLQEKYKGKVRHNKVLHFGTKYKIEFAQNFICLLHIHYEFCYYRTSTR